MPYEIQTNRLLSWAVGIFLAYWTLGLVSDHMWFSVVISACIFVGGVLVSIRSVPEALGIIRRDQIGSGELAVISLALLSTGAVLSGAFNMIYAAWGWPDAWIGPFSSFGRAMMTVGFFSLFLSPDTSRQGVQWPRWYILLGAAAMIAIMSFLLGYMIRSDEPDTMSDLLVNTSRVPPFVDLMTIRRT